MFAAARSTRCGARGWRRLQSRLGVAPQHTLSTTTVPPGVTVVGSKADAERVISIIRKLPKGTYHAWDTETTQIDLETQSPVGHGRVICASMYSGPDVDYGSGPRVWIPNLDAHDVGGGVAAIALCCAPGACGSHYRCCYRPDCRIACRAS